MPTIALVQLRWSPFRHRAGLRLPTRATMALPRSRIYTSGECALSTSRHTRTTQAVKNRTQLSKRGEKPMQIKRCALFFLFAFSFAVMSLPVFAQKVIATVPVGSVPYAAAVNPVTNKTYIVNFISDNVTVIDGATFSTTNVTVGSHPVAVAVNSVTDKIYVANQCGNDFS